MYRIEFSKDRQKFSAAHFTIFEDGTVERLHGHNYFVKVAFYCERLQRGMGFPFQDAKRQIQLICDMWDEFVLLPSEHPWLALGMDEDQVEAHLRTPGVEKHYSFPREDVIILPCDNITSEHLAHLFAERLAEQLRAVGLPTSAIEVTLSESPGQSAQYLAEVTPSDDGNGEDEAT